MEQPLPPNFCCNLGSLNLAEFIKNPFTENAHFEKEEFVKAIGTAVKALDDIIDENANNHPLKAQRYNSLNYRNIGLGIFGYASALMKLKIKYGSEYAKKWTDNLFDLLFKEAVKASVNLAKEKGSFPKYKECVFDSKIIKKHFTSVEIEEFKKYGIRNCSLISIAPTGTISTILGETGGCEPEFAIKYTRKTESLNNGQEKYFDIFCKTAQEYLDLTGNEELPDYFVSSADISWKDRVEVQAIMQEHVDTAISSTVNLPKETPIEDIEKLYLYAWKKGLKGITIFRSGCKKVGILTTENKTTETDYEYVDLPRGFIEDVPDGLTYRKYKLNTGCGKLYFFLGIDENDGKIYDCFTNTDGVGGCSINTQANSRLLSAALRGGVPISYLAEQLNKSGVCPSFQYKKGKGEKLCKGKSCPSAIGNILKDVLKEFEIQHNELVEEETKPVSNETITNNNVLNETKCPECGEALRFEGGCQGCICGYSRCS